MDTSQYMAMFIEETRENLEMLNTSLLSLESNTSSTDDLDEIFRVAHTIKGMSATMGMSNMAELTHKMEDVLTDFREGRMQVTSNVISVLFKCLDVLERITDEIEESGVESTEVQGVINELHNIEVGISTEDVEIQEEITQSEECEEEIEESLNLSFKDIKEKFNLNEYCIEVIKAAKTEKMNTFCITVVLDSQTMMKSVRMFMIFNELEAMGEVINTRPSVEDIECENFDRKVELIFVTDRKHEEVVGRLGSISEVEEVLVEELMVDLADEKESKETTQAEEEEPQAIIEHETVKPVQEFPQQKEIVSKDIQKLDDKEQMKEVQINNKKKSIQSVRVGVDRLDNLMELISELVIHRTRLEIIADDVKKMELDDVIEEVERVTTNLQELVMNVRMLPLELVFKRFPRMMRDLSVELGKEIDFTISGEDTELDRTVIEEIGEPLIHILRNAADHGIESKEERIKAGKNPKGTISLSAYQEGTKAIVKVQDDGGGIDPDKIRAKATGLGKDVSRMSDHDVINLIFDQGFSTKTEVSDVSGRGVGMDVVKTKILAQGGVVDVHSVVGEGSTFLIELPLTLQIIQGLLIKVYDETFVMSLSHIDRILEYNEDMVKDAENQKVFVSETGELIPLVDLRETLNIHKDIEVEKRFIVIVTAGKRRAAVVVDELIGQREIVIKNMGKMFESVREYMGATILGEGNVVLILDMASLV